ncbi:ACVRI [Oopsacas minuta]|uniref:Serine/threonine-protein kinase receptor n=1 Tax=Oopsacas minuta TaxID=111878 RepID=A0AAV7JCB9_9METZ|nr:ACVRI [Oopsacas minuta]
MYILFILSLFALLYPVLSCISSTEINCTCKHTAQDIGECSSNDTCIGFVCYVFTRRYLHSISTQWGCLKEDDIAEASHISNDSLCPRKFPFEYSPNLLDECCCTDYCNTNLKPEFTTTATPPLTTTTGKPIEKSTILAFSISIPLFLISIIVLLLILLSLFFRSGYANSRLFRSIGSTRIRRTESYCLCSGSLEGDTLSSGSGSGLPFLQPRTVAKEIQLLELVGQGRFGRVHRGIWRGDSVAVKIFSTVDEDSWTRETGIYNTVLLRHDNILTCLGSDMISNDGVTELWLVTHYHPFGSLYDYLNKSTVQLEMNIFSQLAISAINGLVHLHWDISGTHNKPAIAHRDLKSKNLLVKNGCTICIADFGMAVRDQNKEDLDEAAKNIKQGTSRYLAPEILGETIDTTSFDSYRRVDIYCFGLILWELMQKLKSPDEHVDDYQIPYHTEAPSDPTFEDMREIVFVQKKRPHSSKRLLNSTALASILQIMQECWYQDPGARLTSLRIKSTLTSTLAFVPNNVYSD